MILYYIILLYYIIILYYIMLYYYIILYYFIRWSVSTENDHQVALKSLSQDTPKYHSSLYHIIYIY